MNFYNWLAKNKVWGCSMCLVDRFSKMTHFIA